MNCDSQPRTFILLKEHLAISENSFDFLRLCQGDAIGTWWVESRAAIKPSTMHKTTLTAKNILAQNFSGAEGEKPCIMRVSTKESVSFIFNY